MSETNSEKPTSYDKPISYGILIFSVLLILKITEQITLSWFIVFGSLFIVPVALVTFFVILVAGAFFTSLVVAGILAFLDWLHKH